METILVTGGLGFLGQHLVACLLRSGKKVRIFARTSTVENVITQRSEGEIIWGDIRDQKAVEKAIKGVDKVVHLVSNFRKGGSDKEEAYAINVEGTKNVLNACRKFGVKRLVHCSTIGVHGNVQKIPSNEESSFNPGDLYQETKLVAEKLVWEFYKKTKLPISVVRPISIFGPGDFRMLKLFRMIKNGRFVIVGDGKPLFQPAYIDDVVQGFMLCLEKKEAIGEVFIVGGEEYLPLNELFKFIAHELNVSCPRMRVPLFPVLCLADLCEKICAPFGLEPPLHRRRVSFFQNNRAFSIEKAKRVLGFKPNFSLQSGIRETIKWYEKEKLL